MKVFNSGKLIEDLQELLWEVDCDYMKCPLSEECHQPSDDALCCENIDTFKQIVLEHYSHEVEEVEE